MDLSKSSSVYINYVIRDLSDMEAKIHLVKDKDYNYGKDIRSDMATDYLRRLTAAKRMYKGIDETNYPAYLNDKMCTIRTTVEGLWTDMFETLLELDILDFEAWWEK